MLNCLKLILSHFSMNLIFFPFCCIVLQWLQLVELFGPDMVLLSYRWVWWDSYTTLNWLKQTWKTGYCQDHGFTSTRVEFNKHILELDMVYHYFLLSSAISSPILLYPFLFLGSGFVVSSNKTRCLKNIPWIKVFNYLKCTGLF